MNFCLINIIMKNPSNKAVDGWLQCILISYISLMVEFFFPCVHNILVCVYIKATVNNNYSIKLVGHRWSTTFFPTCQLAFDRLHWESVQDDIKILF